VEGKEGKGLTGDSPEGGADRSGAGKGTELSRAESSPEHGWEECCETGKRRGLLSQISLVLLRFTFLPSCAQFLFSHLPLSCFTELLTPPISRWPLLSASFPSFASTSLILTMLLSSLAALLALATLPATAELRTIHRPHVFATTANSTSSNSSLTPAVCTPDQCVVGANSLTGTSIVPL
jgi:hypothetical protein